MYFIDSEKLLKLNFQPDRIGSPFESSNSPFVVWENKGGKGIMITALFSSSAKVRIIPTSPLVEISL